MGCKSFNVDGCFLYDYKICKMLVKFGADVNLLNFKDQRPLNEAEGKGEFSICKLFVKKRKEKKINYKKALHICAKQDDFEMCKIHIREAVDVNETDENMRTPLHVAMIFAIDAMCDLFSKYGAYVDDPIQLGFYYGHFELRGIILCDLSYVG